MLQDRKDKRDTDILEETKTLVKVKSVWEQILTDEIFPYPDY